MRHTGEVDPSMVSSLLRNGGCCGGSCYVVSPAVCTCMDAGERVGMTDCAGGCIRGCARGCETGGAGITAVCTDETALYSGTRVTLQDSLLRMLGVS